MIKRVSESRIANQAKIASQVVFTIGASVFTGKVRADRELARFFRANKKFGSNDRRFISETVFSFFRWWGWVRQFTRNEATMWDRDPGIIHTIDNWNTTLLAAVLLDSYELHPVAAFWKTTLSAKGKVPDFLDGLAGRSLEERAVQISKMFNLSKLSVNDVVPAWFPEHVDLTDEKYLQLLTGFQQRPPIWLRNQGGSIDRLATALGEAGLTIRRSLTVTQAIRVEKPRANLYDLPCFREGRFEVQDLSSQAIGLACEPRRGERWWDVCAGAGGKSLQLASIMESKGTVIATDIRSWKLKDLRKRARRAGFSNISPREWDGKSLPVRKANLDGVLVDAPCSCSGTWRRNPDARWTSQPQDIMELSAIQSGIVNRVCNAVKSGGTLVYGTCSTFPAENEEVVRKFLKARPEFSLDPFRHPISGKQVSGMTYIQAEAEDSDVSFVARMKRK